MDITLRVSKNRDAAINIYMLIRTMFIDMFSKVDSGDIKLGVAESYDMESVEIPGGYSPIFVSAFSKYRDLENGDIEYINEWRNEGEPGRTFFMEICMFEDNDADNTYRVAIVYKPLNTIITVEIADDKDNYNEYTVFICNSCADIKRAGISYEESSEWLNYMTKEQRHEFDELFGIIKKVVTDECGRSNYRKFNPDDWSDD